MIEVKKEPRRHTYCFLCRVSERQISIYKANDLSAPLNTVGLDVSPAILMPFYDEDSSTLFVTGKVWNSVNYYLNYESK